MATYEGVANFEGKLYRIKIETAQNNKWNSEIIQDLAKIGIYVEKNTLVCQNSSCPSNTHIYKKGKYVYGVELVPNQILGTAPSKFIQRNFYIYSTDQGLKRIDADLIASVISPSGGPSQTVALPLPSSHAPYVPVSGDPLDPRRAITNTPTHKSFVPPGSFGGPSILPPPIRPANSPFDPFGGPQLPVPFKLLNPPRADAKRSTQFMRV